MTALAVAAGRAVETTRPGALVADPYAAALVAGAQSNLDLPTAWPADPASAPPLQQPLLLASTYIGLRSRFIDDFLRREPVTAQTVILGAGLDTRAYRLEWPAGSRVLELDHSNVLEYKARVMESLCVVPACELVTVPADLSQPWGEAVITAGFDRQKPTTWIVEGLLPYLSAEAQLATLKEVASLSPAGSRAAIERAVALPATEEVQAKLRDFSAQTGLSMEELLARADPPDPAWLLESAGWNCAEHSVAELSARYGRAISLDATDEPAREDRSDGTRGGFVTAWLPAPA
jgi:methyltransferase (TIGR00027 family)